MYMRMHMPLVYSRAYMHTRMHMPLSYSRAVDMPPHPCHGRRALMLMHGMDADAYPS